MPNVSPDTPDNQRGFFSPQVLLAEVPANTATITVGIPPNAETILITASGTPSRPTVICEGVGTLYKYAGVALAQNQWITSAPTWAFDVSYAVDQEVTITLSLAPSEPWYIYADAAARVTWDATVMTNVQGLQYVVPTVPSEFASDHPPNEVSATGAQLASSANLLGNPGGAGLRWRLFSLNLVVSGAGGVWVFQDGGGSIHYLWCVGTGQNAIQFPGQGIPMPANDSLAVYNWTGGGTCYASVVYAIEDV